ncbi:hypothetical protein NLJ89_g11583 [Agrocybe chaxingu]|uniref:XPG-I domain-containing protein n=1 Tax=Agrocybe chaxingu TaxID=84603 RepID=A0A9W8JNG3_9AGAR|nr:hypothetical protein NLJ89_g11583 [Agrocybe chaxingu]
MGINGLWKAIETIGQRKSLTSIAYDLKRDGHLSEGRGLPCFGVDLSPCMDECVAATMAQGVNGQLPGGPLYIFFHKLVAYLEVPATFVFVFDGPKRPATKRGRQVRHQVWWGTVVEELILAFGFRVHHAPGEAEAELAMLNHLRMIDGVITSDSDAFIFGTRRVIRTIPNKLKEFTDEFEVYSADGLEEKLRLTLGGVTLFALLAGGDYDETGVSGCGQAISLGLAQCGFGDELLATSCQFLHSDGAEFDHFIQDWRASLCEELRTNSRGNLSGRRPDIAQKIENSEFPDSRIVTLYIHPSTSADSLPDPASWFLVHDLLLNRIAQFCQQHLQWPMEGLLKNKLKKVIFPAIVLRMLHSPMTFYDSETRMLIGPAFQVTIHKVLWKTRKGHFASRYGATKQPRLIVSTSNFLALLGYPQEDGDSISVWAPREALPLELQDEDQLESGPSKSRGPRRKKRQTSSIGTKKRAKGKHSTYQMPSAPSTSVAEDCIAGPSSLANKHPIQWLGFIDLTSEAQSETGSQVSKKEVIDLTTGD